MNFNFKHWGMAFLLATLGTANCWAQGHGTFTCNIDTPLGISSTTNYVFGGANFSTVAVPVVCTQSGATANNGDTVIVAVEIGNSNSAPATIQNTATRAGAPTINYDFYTNSSCNIETHTTRAQTSLTFIAKNTTIRGFANAILCVPVPVAFANGTYTDTVITSIYSVSPTNNAAVGVSTVTGTISVSIAIPERCDISMPAGPLAFTYTSFSNAASTASKIYSVTCGSSLSPTMALTDVNGAALTTGTAAGLAYTLALNTMANSTGGTPRLDVASGGTATNYRINGNMAAGQAGSCAAPAVQAGATCTQTITGVHYLTVTW